MDEVISIRRLAHHIRFMQRAVANPLVEPLSCHAEMAGEAVNRPHVINLVSQAMLMVPTDPLVGVAELQDGAGQDAVSTRRAKPFTAQGLGNLRIRVAL